MKDYPSQIADREQAIDHIQECRALHVEWELWQQDNKDWKAEVEPEDVGVPEYHRQWVTKYDHVLSVLKGQSDVELGMFMYGLAVGVILGGWIGLVALAVILL